MSEAPFVHLHVHSEYSIRDGACSIPDLAARAAELEMPAVSLTDHGSLAGAVQLYREAKKQGIKPIVGCVVYVADDRRAQTKGNAHLTLLAADNDGYVNLIKLSSSPLIEVTPREADRRDDREGNPLDGPRKGASREPDTGSTRHARVRGVEDRVWTGNDR